MKYGPNAPFAASESNTAFYFKNFVAWARRENRKYFYFEAFDEIWKGAGWPVLDTPSRNALPVCI